MIKNKLHFCTYSSGKKYDISSKHIIKMAKKSGLFNKTKIYSPIDLEPSFRDRFNHILSQPRGGGFWLWKHHIIEKELSRVNNNDFVIYSDAGSSFNYHGTQRFQEYIEMLNSSNYGTFRMEGLKQHKEKYYTKKEIFNYFDVKISSRIADTSQYMGGHLIFKKNDHTLEFMNQFKATIYENIELITDSNNKEIQIEEFIENRHDQSIMSLISKKIGTVSIQNETYFDESSTTQFQYPFLSVRHYGHKFKDRTRYYLNHKKYREPIFF